MVRSQTAMSTSVMGESSGNEPPAELKSVSIRPNLATAAATAAATLASSVTSIFTNSASPPCAITASAAA